jgi:hypothetical protein
MFGRLPWLALERRSLALRFFVFFDMGAEPNGAVGCRHRIAAFSPVTLSREAGMLTIWPMWSRALAAAGLLALGTGCASGVRAAPGTTVDYREAGETAIELAMAQQFGVGVDARCDEPPSTEPQATFDCTGITTSGTTLEFIATITPDREVTIQLGEIP